MWLFSLLLCESDKVSLMKELLYQWFWFLVWSLGAWFRNLVQNSHFQSLSKCFALKVSVSQLQGMVACYPSRGRGLPQIQSLPRLQYIADSVLDKQSHHHRHRGNLQSQMLPSDSFGRDGSLSNQEITIQPGQKPCQAPLKCLIRPNQSLETSDKGSKSKGLN